MKKLSVPELFVLAIIVLGIASVMVFNFVETHKVLRHHDITLGVSTVVLDEKKPGSENRLPRKGDTIYRTYRIDKVKGQYYELTPLKPTGGRVQEVEQRDVQRRFDRQEMNKEDFPKKTP